MRPIARAGVKRAACAAGALIVALTAGAACSGSGEKDRSGAVTHVEEVGPELAELRNEVARLNEIVRQLQAQVTELRQQVPPPSG